MRLVDKDIFLGGLLLPLRLYFTPQRFGDSVAALAPDLPRNYSMEQAKEKYESDPTFHRAIRDLWLQAAVAVVLWIWLAPATLLLLEQMGIPVDWGRAIEGIARNVALGVAFGVAWGVALGVAGGVAGGVALGVAGGVAGGVAFGVALGVALGVAGGVAGGVALGVALGVAGGVALGVALGVASILATTHLPHIFFQLPLSLGSWWGGRVFPRALPALWRVCPVRWDDIILVPLPGLPGFLATLYRTYPTLGKEAIATVAAHPTQQRAAGKALTQIAYEEAAAVGSLEGLAAFQQGLTWVTDAVTLDEAAKRPLLRMRDISTEVSSALRSDSATNKHQRLQDSLDLLTDLRQNPGAFGGVLARWEELLEKGVAQAEFERREEEPTPQLFSKDGRPLRPTAKGERLVPFRGRETLIRKLERDVGGRDRATYMLLGPRRIGKTSVLYELPNRLGSQIVPAFVDMQDFASAETAATLLHDMGKRIGDECFTHRGLLLPSIGEEKGLGDEPYRVFQQWLDKVERALESRTLLLCIDEFEALETAMQAGRLDERILSLLRTIVQHRTQIAVLLSGVHHMDELPPTWASHLINVTNVPVSFLEEEDARDLIVKPVNDFPPIFPPAVVDEVVRLSHCHPRLVQLLCALLVDRMNEQKRTPESPTTVADVEAVVPKAFEHGGNYFLEVWNNHTNGEVGREVLRQIVHAPGHSLSRDELRAAIADETVLRAAVKILRRREIIVEQDGHDGRYEITVPLMRMYVMQKAEEEWGG